MGGEWDRGKGEQQTGTPPWKKEQIIIDESEGARHVSLVIGSISQMGGAVSTNKILIVILLNPNPKMLEL